MNQGGLDSFLVFMWVRCTIVHCTYSRREYTRTHCIIPHVGGGGLYL